MEVKALEKEKVLTAVPESKTRSIVSLLEDIKNEAKQITWTNKEELWIYTKIVVAATFVFGIGIYCVDLVIQLALFMLSSFMGSIFG